MGPNLSEHASVWALLVFQDILVHDFVGEFFKDLLCYFANLWNIRIGFADSLIDIPANFAESIVSFFLALEIERLSKTFLFEPSTDVGLDFFWCFKVLARAFLCQSLFVSIRQSSRFS